MEVEAKPSLKPGWSVKNAEALLNSLKGVVSARVVARPDGGIEEVHLLTTSDVSAKQSVRNVESALRAHFDLKIDHRTVSVAQTNGEDSGEDVSVFEAPVLQNGELRFLFVSHQVETERSHRLRIPVTVGVEGRGVPRRGDRSRPAARAPGGDGHGNGAGHRKGGRVSARRRKDGAFD